MILNFLLNLAFFLFFAGSERKSSPGTDPKIFENSDPDMKKLKIKSTKLYFGIVQQGLQ